MAFNAIPGFSAPPGVQQQFICEVLSGLPVVAETHRDTWQEQADSGPMLNAISTFPGPRVQPRSQPVDATTISMTVPRSGEFEQLSSPPKHSDAGRDVSLDQAETIVLPACKSQQNR